MLCFSHFLCSYIQIHFCLYYLIAIRSRKCLSLIMEKTLSNWTYSSCFITGQLAVLFLLHLDALSYSGGFCDVPSVCWSKDTLWSGCSLIFCRKSLESVMRNGWKTQNIASAPASIVEKKVSVLQLLLLALFKTNCLFIDPFSLQMQHSQLILGRFD